MRLTNNIRKAILARVMNDLPKKDFRKQAQRIAQDEAFKALPRGTKEIFEKHPEIFQRNWYTGDFYIVRPGGWKGPTVAAQKKIDALLEKDRKQQTSRENAERQLRQALASVTTVKRAKECFPDLQSYLPIHEAINQLMIPSDLPALKAAGFKGSAKK